MVVNHVIPLQGKIIKGEHRPSNLQYLTPEENSRKNNKYPYDGYDINKKRITFNDMLNTFLTKSSSTKET